MSYCDFCKKEVNSVENRCPECGCTIYEESTSSDIDSWQSEVLDLLKRGEKIAAIKIHRENTGSGLAEAKTAVEKMAADYEVPASAKTGCAGMLLFLFLLPAGLFFFSISV